MMASQNRLGFLVAFVVGATLAAVPVPLESLPFGQWRELSGGPGTFCGNGIEFSFFARRGTVNSILIQFLDNTVCSDAATCTAAASSSTAFVAPERLKRAAVTSLQLQGVFDHANTRNPFRNWIHIAIPLCTADMHLGTNVMTYPSGPTVSHVGARNAREVLFWALSSPATPSIVAVAGCGRASFSAAAWAPLLSNLFPSVPILSLGDLSVGSARLPFGAMAAWGLTTAETKPYVLPLSYDFAADQYVDLLALNARTYANVEVVEFSPLSSAAGAALLPSVDPVLAPTLWSRLAQVTLARIDDAPGAATFIHGGERSVCLFAESDVIYATAQDPAAFLSAVIRNASTPSQHCETCQKDVLPPCRIPLAAQETFSSLAERLKVTPSALYALNGGDQPPSPSHFEGDVVDGAVIGPDGIVSRPSILFAHPYRLYAGETLQSVAAKFGVSAEEVMALNAATSTFVSNPTRLGPGHVVCVLPGVDLIRCPRVQ